MDDMEHAEGWRKVLCNKYVSTLITLVFGYILTQVGYSNIWPLFGSANQLLSALVLITLCVFLKVTGRSMRTLVPPFVIMLMRYLHGTGPEIHLPGSGILRWNRRLHGRRSAADRRSPADDPGRDHRGYLRKGTDSRAEGRKSGEAGVNAKTIASPRKICRYERQRRNHLVPALSFFSFSCHHLPPLWLFQIFQG